MDTLVGSKVYVVSIEHRHGVTVFVHTTIEGAEKALHEWVVENWTSADAIPDDRQEAVDRYFDHLSGESYWMSEETVEA